MSVKNVKFSQTHFDELIYIYIYIYIFYNWYILFYSHFFLMLPVLTFFL
ncbi:MAG: hypothetical protein MCS20_01540 [Candidatus Phytoplasma mali]|nr:hypothetical protein [Candidatus Phytoplasma mali]